MWGSTDGLRYIKQHVILQLLYNDTLQSITHAVVCKQCLKKVAVSEQSRNNLGIYIFYGQALTYFAGPKHKTRPRRICDESLKLDFITGTDCEKDCFRSPAW